MKRPAYQWYPGDFRRDLGVQACSFEARSLWREMLDLMHDGEPYGHLTAGGVPISTDELARLIGKPGKTVAKWIEELGSRKVFSRTSAGVIYSRRQVRDEEIRNKRAKGGGKSLENENVPRPKDQTKDPTKDTNDTSFHRSLGGSPAVAVAVAVAEELLLPLARATKLCAAANLGLSEHPTSPQPIPRVSPGHTGSLEALEALERAGVPLDFAETVIYEKAKSHRAKKITSLGYFTDNVIERWRERNAQDDANRSTVSVGANGAGELDALARWALEPD